MCPIAPQLIFPVPQVTIPGLRAAIDALDDDLLALLNRRARLASEVGRLKAEARTEGPFYAPSRERAIVARLTAANPGPFPAHAVQSVFQEIFSACLSLEKGLRIAFLGPEGTFTHQAVKRQFGLSAQGLPCGTVASVFTAVERGQADFGVVPVENTTEGSVDPTLDTFLDSPLKISAEIILPVSHALLLRHGLGMGDVRRVYSHPQALAQCRNWLKSHLPQAALVETLSTAEAARLAREDVEGGAVASEMAARLYDLEVIREGIQDEAHNATRFLVIGTAQAEPTGRDRTSLLATVHDVPGALLRLLRPLADHAVNLTRIESRPTRRKAWEYAFFLDLEGHHSNPAVTAALAGLEATGVTVKVLGSYPAATVEAA